MWSVTWSKTDLGDCPQPARLCPQPARLCPQPGAQPGPQPGKLSATWCATWRQTVRNLEGFVRNLAKFCPQPGGFRTEHEFTVRNLTLPLILVILGYWILLSRALWILDISIPQTPNIQCQGPTTRPNQGPHLVRDVTVPRSLIGGSVPKPPRLHRA